jgi:predicted enzyme related to lactoylglutathione lyase
MNQRETRNEEMFFSPRLLYHKSDYLKYKRRITMELPTHSISWFEIPVTDFERAKLFYSMIYKYEMPDQMMGPIRMGFFLVDNGGIGGAIVYGEGCIPSEEGSLVYLNGGTDLSIVLDRVEPAGGKIVLPKTKIDDELGYFALFIDSEGNKVGLHSPE